MAEKNATGIELVEYRNSQMGFSIHYPRNWLNGTDGRAVMFRPDDAQRLCDGETVIFSPVVTVLVGAVRGTLDPLKMVEEFVAGLKENFSGFSLLWKKRAAISSGDVGTMYSFQFNKAGNTFRTVGIAICKDTRIYVCDLSVVEPDFSVYEVLADVVLTSFAV